MGLFSKSNSGTATAPLLDGMSAEAKRLAQKAAADASLIAPPPAGLAAALAASSAGYAATPAPQSERQQYFQQLKVRIHQQLVERLDVQNLRTLPPEVVRSEVRLLIKELCQNEKGLINSADQERLMDEVMDETFGLGPLETLLKDPTISDILVNKWDRV